MQWALALITLVFTNVSTNRRRSNVVEENQTKTTLHVLDDSIVEFLTKPSSENSRLIFGEIKNYNTHFTEIIDGFKNRKFRFVRIAHIIYEKGGPNFMKLRLDGPIFMKICGWTMSDMGELYYLLKITHRLWIEFRQVYEEVKTAVKGNWTQLKSTFNDPVAPSDRLNITAMLQNIVFESNEMPDYLVNSTNTG